MELFLSTSTPWDAVWTTSEGKVLYKSSCPTKFFHSETITIEKPVSDSSDDEFAILSKIKVRDTYDSEITFRGHQTKITAEIFKKGARDTGSFGLRNQLCTAPDGREYEWVVSETKVQLVMCDEAKTPVTHFHRQHRKTPWKEANPASLEIFEPGLEIVDYIVTLFIFLEKRRRDLEADAASNKIVRY